MSNALIGYTGFVGGTLLRQTNFDELYRSTNISQIEGKTFDLIVCAGASAKKWIANSEPDSDLQNILDLIAHLKTVECKKFVLISTVDVFKLPVNVNEGTPIDESGLHAYGEHRHLLEKFVAKKFDDHLIVRLPGLVGPGLQKNIIFDFLNSNNLHMIESRGVFQFYPMVNLWSDINVALKEELKLVHLTSEPILVSDIAEKGFGFEFDNTLNKTVPYYNFKSIHAGLFGGSNSYTYSSKEVLLAVRSYAQSEISILKGK